MAETEKKGIGKVKVGLIILAILTITLTISNLWVYTNLKNQINDLETDKSSLHNQVNTLQTENSNLESQVTQLQSTYNEYIANHHYTDSEYNALETPKLIKVNLKAEDSPILLVPPYTPYLHVYGEVCNVGTNTAYNCKLHVIAYQSGGVVAIDTYIVLGTINGESWTTVNSNIGYTGSGLTGWSITPVWTS